TSDLYTPSLHDALPISVHEPGGDQQREERCARHRPALPPRRVDRLSDGLAARLLVAFVERADGLAVLSDLRLKRQQLLDRHRVRSEEHTSELQSRFDLV